MPESSAVSPMPSSAPWIWTACSRSRPRWRSGREGAASRASVVPSRGRRPPPDLFESASRATPHFRSTMRRTSTCFARRGPSAGSGAPSATLRSRACLPGRPARRARARGRLSRRPNAHELHPPPLRLEPRAAARLRRRVRRVARVRAPALAVGVLLAVAPPAAAFSARDMLGREVTLAAPPARIISLVPSATEILYALAAEERLAGVTDFCDYPPAARRRPTVGGMVNPNLEAIVALKPDLVIATTEGNGEETFAQLKRLGIPTYLVAAHLVSDVTDLIARLGALTGRERAMGPVLARLERRIEAVKRAVAPRPRPRVLYVLWPEPLIVPGRTALVTG